MIETTLQQSKSETKVASSLAELEKRIDGQTENMFNAASRWVLRKLQREESPHTVHNLELEGFLDTAEQFRNAIPSLIPRDAAHFDSLIAAHKHFFYLFLTDSNLRQQWLRQALSEHEVTRNRYISSDLLMKIDEILLTYVENLHTSHTDSTRSDDLAVLRGKDKNFWAYRYIKMFRNLRTVHDESELFTALFATVVERNPKLAEKLQATANHTTIHSLHSILRTLEDGLSRVVVENYLLTRLWKTQTNHSPTKLEAVKLRLYSMQIFRGKDIA